MVEALKQGDNSLPAIQPNSLTADQKIHGMPCHTVQCYMLGCPDAPTWHLGIAAELNGQLDIPSLQLAVADLCKRHEVLSTRFQADRDGLTFQKVTQPALSIELGQMIAEDEDHAARSMSEVTNWHYDMENGPLARILLIKLSEQRHWLVIAIHHAISDAESRGILWRDLGRLYVARAQQTSSELPELSLEEADYSAWEQAQVWATMRS